MPAATRARKTATNGAGSSAKSKAATKAVVKRAGVSNVPTDPLDLPAIGDALARFPFRFDVVAIRLMIVDKNYQRPLTSFAKRIEERFNPSLVQTVALSHRANGKYAVIDGQTRMVAAEKLGFEALPALVYEGLTLAEEAEIFMLLATERRQPKSWDRFRSALAAGNPEAKAIVSLVKSVGQQVGPDKSKQIGAINALETCYRRGPIELERTLLNLKAAWPDIVPPGDMIKGMHLFYTPRDKKLKATREQVNDEKLVKKLQVATLAEVRLRAHAAKVAGRGKQSSAAMYIAGAIATIYGIK